MQNTASRAIDTYAAGEQPCRCDSERICHMYRSILVPLDGSPLSEYALPTACDIARRSGAILRLVHVHMPATPNPIYVEGLPVIDERMQSLDRDHERVYLERIRDRIIAEQD